MKRIFAALAVFLLLTGCGGPKMAETTDVIVMEEPQAAAPAPEAEQPAEEEPAVEQLPIEINPDVPMCEDGVEPDGEEADYEIEVVEDLVEDTVAYNLEKPVFQGLNGADKINSFYAEIILNLENFSKSQIFNEAMEKSCIADAYGNLDFARILDGELQVQYRFRAEFSDDTERENVRNDFFDIETGEPIEK